MPADARSPLLAFLALACCACVSGPEAPPVPPELRAPGADPRAVLEELAAGAGRTAGHEALEPLVGDWDVTVYAADSGEPIAAGQAHIDWELGGLVLAWRTELTLGERDVASLALFGYDPRANLYQLAWCSGLSSTMSLARGRGELDDFGIRLVAEERDPSTGEVRRARTVLRLAGDGRLEMVQEFEERPGAWLPITRTLYVRQGAPKVDVELP